VRQLAAAFSRIAGQLAGRSQDRVLGQVRARASSLEDSGSKLPHSKLPDQLESELNLP
jgi:hypothetical protein